MPTYRSIASTETDPEAPLTSALAKAWADNVEAIREGDPTAPKIQPNALRRQTFISAAAAQAQTFTGLDDFGAVEFEVFSRNDNASPQAMNFAFSTDGGSSWSTNQNIGAILATSGAAWYAGSFDFATGQLDVIHQTMQIAGTAPATLNRTSVALSGASLAINAVRFVGAIANHTSIVLLRPAGASQ